MKLDFFKIKERKNQLEKVENAGMYWVFIFTKSERLNSSLEAYKFRAEITKKVKKLFQR